MMNFSLFLTRSGLTLNRDGAEEAFKRRATGASRVINWNKHFFPPILRLNSCLRELWAR